MKDGKPADTLPQTAAETNVLYDFGTCRGCQYCVSAILIEANSNNLTSWYKIYRKQMETHYGQLYEHVPDSLSA